MLILHQKHVFISVTKTSKRFQSKNYFIVIFSFINKMCGLPTTVEVHNRIYFGISLNRMRILTVFLSKRIYSAETPVIVLSVRIDIKQIPFYVYTLNYNYLCLLNV